MKGLRGHPGLQGMSGPSVSRCAPSQYNNMLQHVKRQLHVHLQGCVRAAILNVF